MRRTASVDIGPPHYRGRARDLRTLDGEAVVISTATLDADVDDQRRLLRVATQPNLDGIDALLGASVGSGFRARVAEDLPGAAGSLVGLLLDDLPVAALISGYAALRAAARVGRAADMTPPGVLERIVDVCAGWRSDGGYVASIARGDGAPLQAAPPAPDLGAADPLGWHAMPAVPPHGMRRQRLLDVIPNATGADVQAMFRDSYGEPDGAVVVLHEYDVTARVTGDPPVLADVVAVPRVLPAPECPMAAASAGWLDGVPVATVRDIVKQRFIGIETCTHLNDLLRSLADITELLHLA